MLIDYDLKFRVVSASHFLPHSQSEYRCAAAMNHMIIFLTGEYLRGEQVRCKKRESELDAHIRRDMSRLVSMPRSEYAEKYDVVLDMAAELAQWREYRIELGAVLWVLSQI